MGNTRKVVAKRAKCEMGCRKNYKSRKSGKWSVGKTRKVEKVAQSRKWGKTGKVGNVGKVGNRVWGKQEQSQKWEMGRG